jgi:hypothetical protein
MSPVTRCAVCHRRLTDPYSVAIGVGPECRGKFPKHHFPRPKWKVRRGRVELVGLIPQGNAPLRPPCAPTERVPPSVKGADRGTDDEDGREINNDIEEAEEE